MQSFHHSRGRIFFEVLCSLAISASSAGAWLQTGATALLPAAGVAALYGLVHAFDMRRRKPTIAAVSQVTEVASASENAVPAIQPTFAPPATPEQQVTTGKGAEEGEKTEPEATPSRPRRAKTAPKGARQRSSARAAEKVTELAPVDEVKIAEPSQAEEPKITEVAKPEEANVAELTALNEAPRRPEESSPVPIRPLFEPEPFVRLQRAGFGRKA